MRPLADILARTLLERGVLTPPQLDEVLAAQALYGGSLDTNLLEVTTLTEPDVQAWLESAVGRANAVDITLDPQPAALALLGAEHAERLAVVPFKLEGAVLHVLVNEPSDMRVLDEVGFVTGRRIEVNVATQARIAWHLERAYAVPMPVRLAPLLAAQAVLADPISMLPINDPGFATAPTLAAPLPAFPEPPAVADGTVPPAGAAPAGPAAVGGATQVTIQPRAASTPPRATRPSGEYSIRRRGRGTDPPDGPPEITPPPALREPGLVVPPGPPDPEAAPMAAGGAARARRTSIPPGSPDAAVSRPPVRSTAPPFGAGTTDSPFDDGRPVWTGAGSLDAVFAGTGSADEVAATLLNFLALRFDRILLFMVGHDTLDGWDARGPRLRRENIEAIHLPRARPSVLESAVEHGIPYLGSLPFGDVEELLLLRLGGEWPPSVAVWPLRRGGATIALIYAEVRDPQRLASARGPLEAAVAGAQLALARLGLG